MHKFSFYIGFFKDLTKKCALDLIDLLSNISENILTKVAISQSIDLKKRDRQRNINTESWFLTDEIEVLETLASLIIPSDDLSPGAEDSDVVNSLERMVNNSDRRRILYPIGLYSIEKWALWKYGDHFTKLPQNCQLNLLKIIDQEYQELFKKSTLTKKLCRKFRVLPYMKKGLFPAVELFPMLVGDVFKVFYTSDVSWVWLDYDGPPMPGGYPNLISRKTIEGEFENHVLSQDQSKSENPLRILVCIKQVPDKDSIYTIDESGSWINEEDINFQTNEGDLYALEEALRIRDGVGGEVTILSVGEKRVLKCLKDGLARGADRAIHLYDSSFNNLDAFATAYAIAAAIRDEKFDIVLTGIESADLAFGQTGIIISELLGWAYATMAVDVIISEDLNSAQVKRELEGNSFERVEVGLPAVLTIQTSINAPRYTTLKGILSARKKEIRTLSSGDLGLGASDLGNQGSKIEHIKFYTPEMNKNTIMIDGSPKEIAEKLFQKLNEDARVL